jgi:hypothetical protein
MIGTKKTVGAQGLKSDPIDMIGSYHKNIINPPEVIKNTPSTKEEMILQKALCPSTSANELMFLTMNQTAKQNGIEINIRSQM